MKTVVKVVLFLVIAVLGLGAFILFHDFDSPDLGKTLLDKVGQATGVRMTARTFRLNLLHGLVLEGVDASSAVEGRQFHVALDRLVFAHRLGPLFAGTVAIDKVIFERPQIEVVESSTATASGAATEPPKSSRPEAEPAPSSSDTSRRLALDLKELSVQDGTVTLRQGEAAVTHLEGLNLTLKDITLSPTSRSLAALAGRGTIGLTKGALGTLAVRDATAQFQLANAVLELPALALTTDYGKLASELHLDLNPAPFSYRLKANGDAIDLNKILGAPGGLGPGALQLNADGLGPAASGMKAQGAVTLAAGRLPSIPALRTVDKILGKPALVGSPYKATSAKFSLARETLTLAPFRFESENARVDIVGTAALEGAVDLDLKVATPRQGIQIDGVAGGVLDVLADASGWVTVPLNISGPLDQPTVGPDIKALTAQAKQGTAREAKQAVHKAETRAKEKAADATQRRLPRKKGK